MNYIITGKLLDSKRQGMAKAVIEALFFNTTGTAQVAGRGATAANGSFRFTIPIAGPAGPVPRIRLRLRAGTALHNLAEIPTGTTKTGLDFGEIVYDPSTEYQHGKDLFRGDNRGLKPEPVIRGGGVILQSIPFNLKSVEANLNASKKEGIRLKAELAQANGLAASRAAEVSRVKDTLTKSHSIQLATLRDQLKRIQTENETLKTKTPERVSIEAIALTSGRDLAAAQRELIDTKGGFRLANVSMEIKGVAEDGGKAFSLPPRKELSALGGALSTVKLQFIPGLLRPSRVTDSGNEADASDDREMPSVIGQPEGKARRQLDGERLAYRVYHQVHEDASQHGRVLRQSPAAGARLPEGTTIKLVVGSSPSTA